MQNGGTIDRAGLSGHEILWDRQRLLNHEETVADITVGLGGPSAPGWLVYNRLSQTIYQVVPLGLYDRVDIDLHPEQALDILAVMYSQSYH